jgi:hypothetical protein
MFFDHRSVKKKKLNVIKNRKIRPSTMAQVKYPTYLGGRDWEDHGLKPAQAKSS